jgi:hypothetical protein
MGTISSESRTWLVLAMYTMAASKAPGAQLIHEQVGGGGLDRDVGLDGLVQPEVSQQPCGEGAERALFLVADAETQVGGGQIGERAKIAVGWISG